MIEENLSNQRRKASRQLRKNKGKYLKVKINEIGSNRIRTSVNCAGIQLNLGKLPA
jgi:hypothetical protein